MALSATEKVLMLTVLGAAVSAVATAWFDSRVGGTEGQRPTTDGAQASRNPGSSWTGTGNTNSLSRNPDPWVYQGPGRQETRSSFNGQIYAKRFHRGGQFNSPVNFEQSYAIQTSTKNPFANGTNNSYAMAVNAATQDPTNQVSSLVLGPGVSPNNTCASPTSC